MPAAFDRNIVRTPMTTPGCVTEGEAERIHHSLRVNGLAVLLGFVDRATAAHMQAAARSSCDHGYDLGAATMLGPLRTPRMLEFRHPYLVSKECVDFVTNEVLQTLLEEHLGSRPIIHNALFQMSLPAEKQELDYHIDCGSVKAFNPGRKFADFRLRTILYLSDVRSGGFSCILGSAAEALKTFLPLPPGRLMPPEAVPPEAERRVIVNEPAGTLVIFNTHGLHRPEIPREERVVLNTWFASQEFSGNLPPVLFSMKLVDPKRYHRLHVFAGERGCPLQTGPRREPERSGFMQRLARRLGGLRPGRTADHVYEG